MNPAPPVTSPGSYVVWRISLIRLSSVSWQNQHHNWNIRNWNNSVGNYCTYIRVNLHHRWELQTLLVMDAQRRCSNLCALHISLHQSGGSIYVQVRYENLAWYNSSKTEKESQSFETFVHLWPTETLTKHTAVIIFWESASLPLVVGLFYCMYFCVFCKETNKHNKVSRLGLSINNIKG